MSSRFDCDVVCGSFRAGVLRDDCLLGTFQTLPGYVIFDLLTTGTDSDRASYPPPCVLTTFSWPLLLHIHYFVIFHSTTVGQRGKKYMRRVGKGGMNNVTSKTVKNKNDIAT